MSLQGKKAIVVGGSGGIGGAICVDFAKKGTDILIADLLETPAILEKISNFGQQGVFVKTDITRETEVNAMVNAALAKFKRIDILVNSGGIIKTGPIVDLEEKDWDAVMHVNAKGVFLCIKAVAKHMIQQRSGKIINIASQAGKTGEANIAVYAASKAAVISLTQVAALELAPYKVNVNAICPGFVDTKMFRRSFEDRARITKISYESQIKQLLSGVPLGRLATDKDIAQVAAFLASDNSDYMTGQSVNVTGGKQFH